MKLKPNAILFDLDGVLVDSFDAWLAALNDAFKIFNYKEITKEEFLKKYWGYDLFDNLKKMNLSFEVGRICNNQYKKHLDKVKIHPDTKIILNKLNMYRKVLITNTPKDSAIQVLKKFNIDKYFEFVLTSNDVTMPKPDPEIVLKSCNLLDVNPAEVILIGDTKSDVKAGKAAGCKVVGINIDGDYIVNNLAGLLKLIVH